MGYLHNITIAAAIPYELDRWASADADEWPSVGATADAAEAALHVYRWACADMALPVADLADAVRAVLVEAARLVQSARQAAHDFAVADTALFDHNGYMTWRRDLPSIEFEDIGALIGDGRGLTADWERRLDNRDERGRVIGHLSPGQAGFLHDLTEEAFAGTPIADEVGKLQRGLLPDHDEVATYDLTDEQKELFLATTWVTLDVGTGSRARPQPQQVLGRRMAAMAWGVSESEWIVQETSNDFRLGGPAVIGGGGGWGTAGKGP